jgi:branched-chain amino acid transport system permease protein
MQIWINGLLQGALIGAIGVAFALVYRTTRVFHVALGGIYVLAPYLVLSGIASGMPVVAVVILAIGVCAAVGVLAEESIHWPLSRKQAPSEVHLIGSLGAYLVLVQCIALIWGNETRVLRAGVDATWSLLGVTVAMAQIVGPLTAAAAVLALWLWLQRAMRGLELRALADNPVLVALLGRNVRALRRWVFALSGGLAAIAALALAWDVGFDPHIGLKAVLLGMVAMIIGGTASFVGPFLGGLMLGVLRAQVVWYGSARWEEAVTFAVLAIFLFWRPQGIFGRRMRVEDAP